MLQLILHGIGDYFFQTDFQAVNKKKKGMIGLWACLKHCLTYSLPFLFIGSWQAVSIIFATHFIIDRTNIVAYIIAYKNRQFEITGCDIPKERPFALTIWLYIICDNLCHIICNYVALRYF